MKFLKLFLLSTLLVVLVGGFALPPVYAGHDETIIPPQSEETTLPSQSENTTPPSQSEETTDPSLSAGGIKLFDPIEKSIEDIFRAILDIIMVFAIPIVLFFIVWAGFLYVTAAGNQEKISKATKALTYAVVGGVIVLGANVLLAVITNTIKLFT